MENDKQTTSWAVDFDEFRGELRLIPPRYPVRFTSDGIPCQPCDCTWNFGVVRIDVAREIGWDEDLALLEHQDWFYRLHRQWKSAIGLGVSVRHHSDRPSAEYNMVRNTAGKYQPIAERKIGLKLTRPVGGLVRNGRPNVVVLGVGHSNTTITTQQIAALGWNLGSVDQCAENVDVRRIYDVFGATGEFDAEQARRVLAAVPEPWVLKDPRFHFTLTRCLAVFAEYQPALVWIRKDLVAVAESYRRRGEDARRVADKFRLCQLQFDRWPWGKLAIDAEGVAEAVGMFDVGRTGAAVQSEAAALCIADEPHYR